MTALGVAMLCKWTADAHVPKAVHTFLDQHYAIGPPLFGWRSRLRWRRRAGQQDVLVAHPFALVRQDKLSSGALHAPKCRRLGGAGRCGPKHPT